MRIWIRKNDVKEYDVKFAAWQIYKRLYTKFLKDFNYEGDVIKEEKGKSVRPYLSSRFYHKTISTELKFSGETDFNFSKKKIFGYGRSRYQHFREFLNEKDGREYDEAVRRLDICCKKHHSYENISIMPQTGGMNLLKKGIGNDRLDVWVWCINKYYLQESNLLYNFCSYEHMECLKAYLQCFDNVYDYCAVIYKIDEKLTHDLIVSGSKSIDSAERVLEYISLAERFWEQKRKYIENCMREDEGECLPQKKIESI